MKPLVVLLTAFCAAFIIIRITGGTCNLSLAGRIAMAVMLLFTAFAHFKFQKGMAMMLPGSIPCRKGIIHLTGILEISGAIGLLARAAYKTDAWLLVFFLILVLPANVYAAVHHINLEKADNSGNGIKYLWFRVLLQLFFIAWIWYFALYKG